MTINTLVIIRIIIFTIISTGIVTSSNTIIRNICTTIIIILANISMLYPSLSKPSASNAASKRPKSSKLPSWLPRRGRKRLGAAQ